MKSTLSGKHSAPCGGINSPRREVDRRRPGGRIMGILSAAEADKLQQMCLGVDIVCICSLIDQNVSLANRLLYLDILDLQPPECGRKATH